MNCQKSILITISFIAVTFNLMSQNSLSIHGIKENGEAVNKNNIFLLNDACTFYIQDDKGEKQNPVLSEWQLICKDDDDNDIIERAVNNQSEYTFIMDDLRINTTNIRRIKSNSDNSVYFEAYIRCFGSLENGNSFDLSFPIYLNLLPSIPSGEIINFFTEGYWIFLDISCDSERAEQSYFVLIEYDGLHTYTTVLTIKNPLVHSFSIDSQLIAKYMISSNNKYGRVDTEYIEIPDYVYTSIEDVDANNLISFHPNPFHDYIDISGDLSLIKSIRIYNTNGQTVKKIFSLRTNRIYLGELPSGIYILGVELNSNKSNKSYKKYKLLFNNHY